jgi:hypothetical protein
MNSSLSPISFFSIKIEMKRNGHKIGNASGFIYRPKNIEQNYLITNYHVITCRNPKDPKFLLPEYPDSPDEICFSVLTKNNYELKNGGFSLLEEEKPSWIEHKYRNKGVDIVAIPINFPDDAIIVNQQQLGLVEDIKLEIGSDVFIVGFPFGFGADDYYPIWKRGTIASEPLLNPEGLPRFYVDSFTKPGMSGSPVFLSEVNTIYNINQKDNELFENYDNKKISALEVISQIDVDSFSKPIQKKVYQFIGIYSGKITVHNEKDPNIGIVWKKQLIEELFKEPCIVEHPFPPAKVIM